MFHFSVKILGSASALPTPERQTSAQVINYNFNFFLIDCGEGTQIAMKRFGVSANQIHHIFISHLHGDHYFGLPGLLNSMHLHNRKKDLHLYCFKPFKEIMDSVLNAGNTTLTFKIQYHFLEEKYMLLFENKYLRVFSFPLNHRIPTCGFLFSEKKRSYNISKDFVKQHSIPIEWFSKIQNGEDYIDEYGKIYPNTSIVTQTNEPRSYAYCSDTIFEPEIIKYIENTDVLYHEASFTNEFSKIASEKFHSTAADAARIALMANVGTLILGHFSSRFKNTQIHLEEAQAIFPNSVVAYDGFEIPVLSKH